MNDLGFIVGHPTQFESPFYQTIAKEHGDQCLTVYFKDYINDNFEDPELGIKNTNSYGLDLLTGYSWVDFKKWDLASIKDVFRNNRYVIVNGYNSIVLIAVLLVAKSLNKRIGLRLDTVLWNNNSIWKRGYKRILLKVLNALVDTFWVTGTKAKEYLNFFGIRDNKIKVFSYVVDNDWFDYKSSLNENQKRTIKRQINIPEDNQVILVVAKLITRESPIDLIDAFHQLNERGFTLLIVGDGNERQNLENYVRHELKNNDIVFNGFVKYTELPMYYGISDLFVHPSNNEPWGVSVQEAMACGLPVITSNFVGAGYDLISEGKNGYKYEFGNIPDLISKLKIAITLNKYDVRLMNQEILKDWSYKATWERIYDHIHSKTSGIG